MPDKKGIGRFGGLLKIQNRFCDKRRCEIKVEKAELRGQESARAEGVNIGILKK